MLWITIPEVPSRPSEFTRPRMVNFSKRQYSSLLVGFGRIRLRCYLLMKRLLSRDVLDHLAAPPLAEIPLNPSISGRCSINARTLPSWPKRSTRRARLPSRVLVIGLGLRRGRTHYAVARDSGATSTCPATRKIVSARFRSGHKRTKRSRNKSEGNMSTDETYPLGNEMDVNTTRGSVDLAAPRTQRKLASASKKTLARVGSYLCFEVLATEIRAPQGYTDNAINDLSPAEHAPLPPPLSGVTN
jgi:hypothetical protein